MKFFRLWKEKKIIKLGETNDEADAKWYDYDEKLEKFLGYLKRDDSVTITANKVGKKNVVVYLKKLEPGEVAEDKVPAQETPSYETPKQTHGETVDTGKKLTTDEQIKRLSIMRAVGEAVGALAGQISKEEVVGFMCDTYDRLKLKVEE